jgi:hypothetical protein
MTFQTKIFHSNSEDKDISVKTTKKVIPLAMHKPTGAMIPVEVLEKDNNIIVKHREVTEGRRGFTLSMLQDRWDKDGIVILEMLQKYEVPGHIVPAYANSLNQGSILVNHAVFFEEYIYGIEKKEKLSHNKLKSRKVETIKVQ